MKNVYATHRCYLPKGQSTTLEPNSGGSVLQIFERETNREKNLEKAVKEAKVKARKEAAKTSDTDKDRALDEQDILKVNLFSCVVP